MYCVQDEVDKTLKRLKHLRGAYVEFFKNGQSQGKAWENEIYEGAYYPCLSLYKGCTVSTNFGPKFKFPPQQPHRALCERSSDLIVECCMADMLYAVGLEADGDK